MSDENLEVLRTDFWNALRRDLKESSSLLQPGNTTYGRWLNFKLGEFKGMSPLKKHITINQYITIVWVEGSKAQARTKARERHLQ